MWISERSPPDHRPDHRDPFPVHPFTRLRGAARPPRFASFRPRAAAPGSSSPGQQPGNPRAAAAGQQPPGGASLVFAIYVTNRDIFDKSRIPVKGVIFYPFRIGASPLSANTLLRCLIAKFFIFIFFILAHGVQSLILGHF